MRLSRFRRLRRRIWLSVLTCTASKKASSGRAQGGHRGHGGGEIFGFHCGGDFGLGCVEGGEEGFFLRRFCKFNVCAVGIFHAVFFLGLGEDVVGAFEPLQEVFTVVGFEGFGESFGAFDEEGQVVVGFAWRCRRQ